MTSASTAIPQYLDAIKLSKKSPNTIKTYKRALRLFSQIIGKKDELSPENYIKFLKSTSYLSSSSQVAYRVAVSRLYTFHAPGVPVQNLTDQYGQKKRKRFIKYNEDGVDRLIQYAEKLSGDLPALRDRSFIITLADTGLRISEACSLNRGDIDFAKVRALIVGKGDKPGIIRFSPRALDAIRLYLGARAEIDGKSGLPLGSLPVFARHGPKSGKKTKRIGVGGMTLRFRKRAREAGLSEEDISENGPVTAHKLRHRFVTTILRAANGNPAIAKVLARHEDINTTMGYGHLAEAEIDQVYREIFSR